MSRPTLETPLTRLLGIDTPVLLAGMNVRTAPSCRSVCRRLAAPAPPRSPSASPTAHPLFPILLTHSSVQGVSHSELAAAVTNGGGLGVIGGLTMSPDQLTSQIKDIKANLVDKSGNFGVDLAIPQVGGNARKTNHDYTHGHLPELIDVIIEEQATLFVCAVGERARSSVSVRRRTEMRAPRQVCRRAGSSTSSTRVAS